MRSCCILGALALAAGCATPEVVIRNPMVVHAIDANRIVHPHNYVERARGLPPGSVADEASLTELDPGRVCFGLSVHELDGVDLQAAEALLKVPKMDAVQGAQVWADPPVFATYQGLIPERRVVGSESYCSARDGYGNCMVWRTRPVYSTVYVPGPVNVYNSHGTMCFANRNLIGPATEKVTLELHLRRQAGGNKDLEFTWSLLGR
jgi:hypothetical protein